MESIKQYMAEAQEIGLKGEAIAEYVKEQRVFAREERTREREERTREREEEAKEKEKEREENEKEREHVLKLKQAESEEKAREREQMLKLKQTESEQMLKLRQTESEQAIQLKVSDERIKQIDKEIREKELEWEFQKVKHQKVEVQDEGDVGNGGVTGTKSFQTKTPYIPKLPIFDENKDDIDAFLYRFETHASTCNWPKDKWTLYIASLFKGNALTLYHSLAAKESLSWDDLKTELLKRYQCTAEGFREKFRSIRPEKGESFSAFLIRTSHFLDRWIELSNTDRDFESLRDLLIREQILQSVSKDLAVFLKERSIKDAEEMCRLADQYKTAHPEKQFAKKDRDPLYESNLSANFTSQRGFGQGRGFPNFRDQRGQFQRRPYQNFGRQNFDSYQPNSGNFQRRFNSQQRGSQFSHPSRLPRSRGFFRGSGYQSNRSQYNSSDALCWHCGCYYHYANECPYKARECSSANASVSKDQTANKVLHCMVSHVETDGLFVESCSVNGFQGSLLRDTGCTTAGVRRAFVLPEQFTGETQRCRSFGGHIEVFPLALVEVCTPYFSGCVTACVIDDPVTDFILGNLPGVSSSCSGAGGSFVPCAVSTRQQEKVERLSPKPLPVPDLSLFQVNPRDFAAMQRRDETLSTLFRTALTDVPVSVSSPTYLVDDDILFRLFPQNGDVVKQVVVPKDLRNIVLHTAHDSIFAGHCGVKRTLQRVLTSFFWPSVSRSVSDYCHSCDTCQRTVARNRVPCVPLHKMPLISTPFAKIAMDIVGPFEPSSSGFRYVLTIVDTATRFPEAIPLKRIDTITVAEALLVVFSRVGLPSEILTDCGTQFVSDLMREIYRLLSISSVTTTPYHPQSNGMVERFNGTLKSMLKKVCRERPTDWDRYIPAVLFAYRELPNSTLGFSPFELLFGHSPRGPLSLLADCWTDVTTCPDDKNVYQYVYDLHNRILDSCRLAQQTADKNTDRYKHFADRKSKPRSLSVNDKVLVLLTDEHYKLKVAWKGPYIIKEKCSPVNYLIDMDGKAKVFHINMLRLYVDRCNVSINLDVPVDTSFPDFESDFSLADILPVECISADCSAGKPDYVDIALSSVPLPTIASSAVGVVEDTLDDGVHLPTLSVKGESYQDVHINPDLSASQKQQITSLLQDFQDVLTDKPGKAVNVDPHVISLYTDTPVRVKSYPLPFAKRQVIEREVQVMLELGVIEVSSSPFNAPVVLVSKPDGSVRFCIDYRALNKVTVFDSEPIPDVEELFCQLSKGEYFVKIDLAKGYWQIPMAPEDKQKTAFQTPFGLFQWIRMPFGLQNAPATFARMMRKLSLHELSAVSFFDDILLAVQRWDQVLHFLRLLFCRLRQFGLTARPCKIHIGFRELEFLGHMISVGKIRPEAKKVDKILAVKRPTSKKQVRSLLGLLSYYRRYVPHFASITAPLTDLTKGEKRKQILWTEECQKCLETVQGMLNRFPVLLLPNLLEDFVLRTDASGQGMGACLLQEKNELLHPVQFASKKFSVAQQKYSTIERECLAIVWALEKFSRFLSGKRFILQTDHRPLTFLSASKTKNNRLLRWALCIQEYSFVVTPIPGSTNVFADLLSRD